MSGRKNIVFVKNVTKKPDLKMRLKDKYKKEAVPEMMKKFGYTSVMAVPKIDKVTVNTGFGREVVGKSGEEQRKIQETILEILSLACGQKAVLTRAKKAIASFKTREGMPIGAMVTLRGGRMYDFLERVIHVVLPRSRDFRGIDQKTINKQGNLTFGIKEHIVFPEISPEKIRQIFGLEVTVVTTAKNKEEGLELLKLLGFPIKIQHVE